MNQIEILKYYSRSDIQDAMLKIAKDREVVGTFKDGSYFLRPDILVYPKDIFERAKKGIVSFHCSVERWNQPMQLSSDLKQEELDNLRKSWDFIIDIDSKSKLEHATIAADVICNFLKDFNVKPTLKYSGSRGIHIAIASEAFPETIDFKPINKQYPLVPQALASFIREKIKDKLLEKLISFEGGVAALVKTVPSVSELSPYSFVEIEKDWGNRHLFRMPYSLHTKKWLVSVPIKIEDLKHLKCDHAKPENVKTDVDFLVNKEGEATELLLQSLDWFSKIKPEPIKKIERKIRAKKTITEENFPPCIKNILNGLGDGKKRSLFTLATFLRAMNWDQNKIEEKIKEWNMKNVQPMKEQMLRTQLKWHFRQSRDLMPANCDTDLFYKSIGICKPDTNCRKNPVNYPFNVMKTKKHKSIKTK